MLTLFFQGQTLGNLINCEETCPFQEVLVEHKGRGLAGVQRLKCDQGSSHRHIIFLGSGLGKPEPKEGSGKENFGTFDTVVQIEK